MIDLPGSSTALTLLFDLSVKAVVVAALVDAGLRLMRVRSAQAAHVAWVCLGLGMFLYPVLRALLPTVVIPVLSSRASPSVAFSFIDPRWSGLVLAIYAGGVAALLARLTVGLVLSRRIIDGASVADDQDLRLYCADRAPANWLRAAPAVLESPRVLVPVTVGMIRPRVILPAAWRSWDRSKLRGVMAHELAHVRRGDYFWQLVGHINLCVFWFHPVSWLLQHRISLAAERACDDQAILDTGDQCRYAEVLIDIASSVAGKKYRVITSGLGMTGSTEIRSRIESILESGGRRSTRLGWPQAIAIAVITISLWTGAALCCWERQMASLNNSWCDPTVPCDFPCPPQDGGHGRE